MERVFLLAATHTYTKGQEIANSITHGIGALLSMAALVLLIVFSSIQGTSWHIVSFTIFGATMLLLYTSSTLVHAFPQGKVKDLFEIFDHSSIYLFIAGTYTPFLLVAMRGTLGWTLFGIVWLLAIGGTVFKVFFVKKFLFSSTILYIFMGWVIIFAWKPLSSAIEPQGMMLLLYGGILYTVGTIFYLWKSFKYSHAVWHLFVVAGSILHFFSIFYYVLPIK